MPTQAWACHPRREAAADTLSSDHWNDNMTSMHVPLRETARIMMRGASKLCPRCGIGRLFATWYTLAPCCPHCRLDLDSRDGDTWAVMYISTAAITGVFVVVMLFWIRPQTVWVGQAVLLPMALLTIGGSLPRRKGLAIAFDYWTELMWETPTDAEMDASQTVVTTQEDEPL